MLSQRFQATRLNYESKTGHNRKKPFNHTLVSAFSSRPWPHMCDPHGDPQTSPQHADPHGFLVWFSAFLKKTMQEIHVDRRVVGWSAGRHVDHPCGGQISPWPARKVTALGSTGNDRFNRCHNSRSAGRLMYCHYWCRRVGAKHLQKPVLAIFS